MTPQQWITLMLASTSVHYLVAAAAYFASGQWGMGTAFLGYMAANFGFIYAAYEVR